MLSSTSLDHLLSFPVHPPQRISHGKDPPHHLSPSPLFHLIFLEAMDFNAFASIIIEIKIESYGFYFLLSKAEVCFSTENERYLALRELLDL